MEMAQPSPARSADQVKCRLAAILEGVITINQPAQVHTECKGLIFNRKRDVEYFMLPFAKGQYDE